MPIPHLLILASRDPTGAICFFLILAIFWGIGALSKMLTRKQEDLRRRQIRGEMTGHPPPPDLAAQLRQLAAGIVQQAAEQRRPPPQPSRPQQQTLPFPPAQVARMTPPRAMPARQKPPIRRPAQTPRRPTAARPTLPAKTPQPPPPPVEVAPPMQRAASVQSAASRKADASTLSRWLRPGTLRQQFILTEILQPPLALRERAPD